MKMNILNHLMHSFLSGLFPKITSKTLGVNYLSKVFEVHHRHKKDHPSGTALMLGKGIAVGKNKDFYKLIGKKYLNK